MSNDVVLGIKLKLDGKDVDGHIKLLTSDVNKLVDATQKSGDVSERSYSKTRKGLESISAQLATARKFAEAYYTAQATISSISGLTRVADQYTLMSAKLNLATTSAQEFAIAQAEINRIASSTQTQLDDIGNLYARLSSSTKELNKSQQDIIKVTEAVANSLRVSGADATATSSTITQLSQALSGSTVQWEDFGQLTDTNIRLVQVVLKGLGTDMGQLKKDMADGKVTSEQVFNAILAGYQQLRDEAAKMPKTVGGSVTEMANAFELYIGKVDKANGITQTIAQTISKMSGNMDTMATVAGGLAGGLAVLFGASMLARINGIAGAIRGVSTAMLLLSRHPLVAVATVGATYLGAKLVSDADLSRLDQLKNELKDFEGKSTRPGLFGPVAGRDEGKISAIKAEIAAIEQRSAAEDKARQDKAAADAAEDQRVREQTAQLAQNKATVLASDIELLKAKGKMREAYEKEAKEVKNLNEVDQQRYVENQLAIDAIQNKKKAADSAASTVDKLANAETKRAEVVSKTLAEIQREIDMIGLSEIAKQRQIELHQALADAQGAEAEQIRARLAVKWAMTDAENAAQSAQEAQIQAINEQVDRYQQLTLSLRELFQEKLKQQGLSPAQAAPVLARFDQNNQLQLQADQAKAARDSLDSYIQSLDKASESSQNFGDVSSAVFDSSLGGINTLAGVFDNLTKSIAKTTNELEANAKAQQANNDQPDSEEKHSNTIKLAKKEDELNRQMLKNQLSGVRQLASATANMYEENTNARRAFNVVALAASVAERAADLAGLGAKAASAVLTQGQGDPYTAFARIAAMAAIVGSVLSAAGAGTFQFGGSSVPKGKLSTAPETGTVLGDPESSSESINNVAQLLEDIHAKEYAELRGINTGVQNLKNSITQAVTTLFRTGGLVTPSGLNLGKISNVPGGGPGYEKIDPLIGIIMKGIFGSTKREVTGQGIVIGKTLMKSVMDGMGINGNQFTEITTTKKSWFSKRTTVKYVNSALNDEFEGSLSSIYQNMGKSLISVAKGLGYDLTGYVNSYVIPEIRVDLHGLSSEKMTERLNAVFSTQIDNFTNSIIGWIVSPYQKLGEGMFEAATRLVAEKEVVMQSLRMANKPFYGDAVHMADGLVQLAGGLENFQAQFSDFYDAFFTEQEKLSSTRYNLTEIFKTLGATLPETREGYKNLAQAQNLNSQSGRALYQQLLELSSAADALYKSQENLKRNAESELRSLAGLAPTVESSIYNLNLQLNDARANFAAAGKSATEMADLTTRAFANLKESILQPLTAAQDSIDQMLASLSGFTSNPGNIDEMTTALLAMTDPTDQVIQVGKIQKAMKLKYDNEISLINQTAQSIVNIKDALQGITDFVEELNLSDLGNLSPEQRLLRSQDLFNQTLASAQAGSSDALKKLTDVSRSYLTEAQNYYASSEQYSSIFENVKQVLTNIVSSSTESGGILTEAELAMERAEIALTSSLVNLQTILDGFVSNLSFKFDEILKNTNSAALPKTFTPAKVESSYYDSLYQQYRNHLGAAGDLSKQGNSVASQNEFKISDTLRNVIRNYQYWHDLGNETAALQSASQVFSMQRLFDQISNININANGNPTGAQLNERNALMNQANIYRVENGGLVKYDTAGNFMPYMPTSYLLALAEDNKLGFKASGGMAKGPTVINENGPELLNFAHPTMVVNNQKTNSIIALGNQDAIDELKNQTKELQALVRLNQAATVEILARLDKGNESSDVMARKARLAAAAA